MPNYDFDLFVIGAGSAGVRASRVAASLGARVAIAEERHLGGTCVNVGCVPKKLLVYASHFAEHFEDAAGFGWSVPQPRLAWATLLNNKNREIQRLNGVYRDLLDQAGVRLFEGRARLRDAHTVEVADQSLTSERIVIATGGWPLRPRVPGIEHAISSNEAFYLEQLPRRATVVGGGYIGVEFAGIFHGLGVDTTLVHRGDVFLRGFDADIRQIVAESMRDKGVTLRFGRTVQRIDKLETGNPNCPLRLTLDDGTTLETDLVLCATGRRPNSRGFGLESVGVTCNEKDAIVVDDGFRTSVPSIYALGDVIDRVALTPVALAEAVHLARHLFAGQPARLDYTNIPTAVFSQPCAATVGLTEQQAREKHASIAVYRTRFRPLLHTLSGREEKTLVKLVVDRETDRVLGCHMVGPDAAEIVQCLAIALRCGASKADFDATIGVHPTTAEEFVTLRTPVAAASEA